MRRLITAILALILFLTPLAALAESEASATIEAYTEFVRRALGRYNTLTYEDNDGDPYFSLVFESNNGRMGDLYAYADVYRSGILLQACYDVTAPEDRMAEILSFINMVNADLFGSKFYVHTDTGNIYYEMFLPMNFTDISQLDKEAEETLYEIFADMTYEADYDGEYFAEIIAGESAKNVYAMYLADYGW